MIVFNLEKFQIIQTIMINSNSYTGQNFASKIKI